MTLLKRPRINRILLRIITKRYLYSDVYSEQWDCLPLLDVYKLFSCISLIPAPTVKLLGRAGKVSGVHALPCTCHNPVKLESVKRISGRSFEISSSSWKVRKKRCAREAEALCALLPPVYDSRDEQNRCRRTRSSLTTQIFPITRLSYTNSFNAVTAKHRRSSVLFARDHSKIDIDIEQPQHYIPPC